MTTPEQDRAHRAVEAGVAAHRLSVIWLALTSIIAGAAMVMTGAPSFIEDWFSPWSRVLLGTLALAPAFCTLVGALIGDKVRRGWWLQAVGLAGQAVWCIAMGGAYIGLLLYEGPQWVTIGEPLSASVSGRGYVPFIYLGLLGLAVIPFATLLKLGRPGR